MSTTTVRTKAAQIYKDWHVIDAAGRPLGRVASEAASLLRGKHKPTFEPHLDGGDFVIIINAAKVRLSGNKAEQKRYYRHSGYPGGLKERTFEQMRATFPERILEQAVWGMLPSGSLGRLMLRHLKVYRGPNHPHDSQVKGSEKAQEARAAALAEEIAATDAKKPPRLRPLPVPADVEANIAAIEAARAEKREAQREQTEAGIAESEARVEEAEEAAAEEALADDEPAEDEPTAVVEEPATEASAADDEDGEDAEAEEEKKS